MIPSSNPAQFLSVCMIYCGHRAKQLSIHNPASSVTRAQLGFEFDICGNSCSISKSFDPKVFRVYEFATLVLPLGHNELEGFPEGSRPGM